MVVKSSGKEGGGRNFRVYLGTIPDFNEEVKGVRLAAVRPGSPAEQAGIKAGDTIVKLGEKCIENLYDYTYALQEHKAGETSPIVVLRDGKEVTLQRDLRQAGIGVDCGDRYAPNRLSVNTGSPGTLGITTSTRWVVLRRSQRFPASLSSSRCRVRLPFAPVM